MRKGGEENMQDSNQDNRIPKKSLDLILKKTLIPVGSGTPISDIKPQMMTTRRSSSQNDLALTRQLDYGKL